MSTKPSCQRGVSLIELIIFIVIISTALIGILAVMNLTSAHSADPLIRKQALAIAESLLEEVELMPFTFCDPDDVNAASAVSAADCSGGIGGANDESKLPLGPEAGETRYSATTPFDNVSDYNGFNSVADGGIKEISGNAIAALSAYSASINVSNATLSSVPVEAALRITVTVDGPGSTQIVLDGYRTRFSPRI
jgi:MSHA pilin protein MshD